MHRTPLPSGTKVILRVLQEVASQEPWESYADLIEVLKCRLAKLKIPYDGDRIQAGIEQLERGGERSLIHQPKPRSVEQAFVPDPITRADADRIYQQVLNKFRHENHPNDSVTSGLRPMRNALSSRDIDDSDQACGDQT